MIAKKLAYMPKARNRAKVESIQDRGDENDSKIVNYTLEEERQLAGANLDREDTSPPAFSSSTISKTASSMWLQSRMQNQPGTSKGGMAMPGKMATGAGKADTRYMTNTSLPYRLPPAVAEAKTSAQKTSSSIGAAAMDIAKAEPAPASASPSSVEARVRAIRARDEFNSFMRSTRFADKVAPSRLVRQCARCQTLYSTGHSCEASAAAATAAASDSAAAAADWSDSRA